MSHIETIGIESTIKFKSARMKTKWLKSKDW